MGDKKREIAELLESLDDETGERLAAEACEILEAKRKLTLSELKPLTLPGDSRTVNLDGRDKRSTGTE